MSLLAVVAVLTVAAALQGRLVVARPLRRARDRTTRREPPGTTAHTAAWAQMLTDMAAAIRSGSSLPVAFDAALATTPVRGVHVGPGRAPWASAGRHGPPSDAVDPDERLVLAVLTAAHRVGGRTAPALDSAAAVLRERIARRAEARVFAAPARASARLLTMLPLGVGVWSAGSSRSVREAMTSPVGMFVAGLGLTFNLAGWWWMDRLVRRAAP